MAIAMLMTAALLPCSAYAQDIGALRLSLSITNVAPKDTKGIALVSKIGACLGSRAETRVLSLQPRSTRSNDELADLAIGDYGCGTMEDRIRYSARYLRGPIAESYLHKMLSGKKMSKSELRIYDEPNAEGIAKLPEDVRTEMALVSIGSCVDASDHDHTVSVFDTEPGSAEEAQALQNLTPILANCVPPGVQLGFTKFDLRGYLAEGSYRNAVQRNSAGS